MDFRGPDLIGINRAVIVNSAVTFLCCQEEGMMHGTGPRCGHSLQIVTVPHPKAVTRSQEVDSV